MRYYIVDKNGIIYGDFNDLDFAELRLNSAYTKQEIEENELEIIEGE